MPRIIALDANVLALLAVGLTDERYIKAHKRTKKYSSKDFATLKDIISAYEEAVFLPHVLAEVSDLLEFDGRRFSDVMIMLKSLISTTREIAVPSRDAANRPEFYWLGVTDCALLEIAKSDIFILSTDTDLVDAAVGSGYRADNFTRVIEAAQSE